MPRDTGVKVKTKIVPQDFVHPDEVAQRVNEELQRYLTPLPLDERPPLLQANELWEGWQFGKDFFAAEVISLIQQIPSVKYVLDVEVLSRPVIPVEEGSMFDDGHSAPLTPVEKILQIPDDGLLCSLEHEVEIANIQDMYENGEQK